MHAVAVIAALALLVIAGRVPAAAGPVEPLPIFGTVVGDESIHAVAAGETLGHIAARFGMKVQLAAAINALPDPHRLRIGQRLRLSNRHIVPTTRRDGVVINVGELALYWLRDGEVVDRFPVGVGRRAWRTPPGHYEIVSRRRDPVWHVPPSIQKEMREEGEPVKKKVPPGPDNPLGKYWLQLSLPGYGLHGTNAPASVGKYATHGCIRLRPDDIERLYVELPNGTAVDVVDEPVKLARLDDGHVLLEAHRGVSGRPPHAGQYIDRLRAAGLAEIDLTAAERVVRDAWGIAVEVPRFGRDIAVRFERR